MAGRTAVRTGHPVSVGQTVPCSPPCARRQGTGRPAVRLADPLGGRAALPRPRPWRAEWLEELAV